MHQWHSFEQFEQASQAAADFLAERIRQTLRQKSECHVILPGGRTPRQCLGFLLEKNLPWEQIHWYPGDERCYPRGHDERNDAMLEKYFWSRIPHCHAHPIPAERGAEQGALAYRPIVESVGQFDIAFLGMGEDGHTASLFPENPALTDTAAVVPVFDSPKPPAERVSFGIKVLRQAHSRLLLAGGASKAGVIARIRQGDALPVNRLGDIHWYIDKSAAGDV